MYKKADLKKNCVQTRKELLMVVIPILSANTANTHNHNAKRKRVSERPSVKDRFNVYDNTRERKKEQLY